MGGDDECAEVLSGFGVRGFLFGDDLLKTVGVVRDDSVNAEVDESADFFRVIGGPGNDLEAGLVEFGYVNCRVGSEECGVNGRQRGSGGAVSLGVGGGCGEESEIGILHGCLLGGGDAGNEESGDQKARWHGG